jgi:Asp-tRNA(Asn)/Glu-tRNA(Gln) amidotransferase A subunit family amidase
MQIVGPAWGEAKILRIAHAYEIATLEVRHRRPGALALLA